MVARSEPCVAEPHVVAYLLELLVLARLRSPDLGCGGFPSP